MPLLSFVSSLRQVPEDSVRHAMPSISTPTLSQTDNVVNQMIIAISPEHNVTL